jgi:RNA polymerase sigma factor (sigma-70 family)
MSEREFLELIKAHKGTIHAACNKYCKDRTVDRSDLVQDIIIELWKSLNNFQKRCSFNTWIYSIARHVSIRTLQRAQRKKKEALRIENLDAYADYLQYEDVTEERIKQLHNAMRYTAVISNVEEPYRSLFLMYLEGVSYKEMEQQTGVPESALRVKICTIKRRLKLRYGS